MGLGATVALATVSCLLGVAGVVAGVVVAVRQYRGHGSSSGASALVHTKLRSVATAVTVLLIVSTFLPWVSGSVAGVSLPSTLWGLPWARWIFGIPALLAVGLTIVTPWESIGWLRIVTCFVLGVCTGLASLATVLVVAATDVTHFMHAANVLLGGLNRIDRLVPVIHVGAGVLAYAVVAVVAVWVVAFDIRLGRRHESPVQLPDSRNQADVPVTGAVSSRGLDPEDDWWR